MLKPPRQPLDFESHQCRETGKNIEVIEGKPNCPSFRDPCLCLEDSLKKDVCSVSLAPSSQSQPKLSPTSEPGYTAQIMSQLHPAPTADFVHGEHPYRKDGDVHPNKHY